MTNKDSSQIDFCKNSHHKVQDITQLVNESRAKIRLQNARLYLNSRQKEILVLDFYPELGDLAFIWDSELVGISFAALDKNSLKSSKHPYLLYLKAHFVGHKLVELVEEKAAKLLRFKFEDGRSFDWDFENKEWIFKVEGKKNYKQRLPEWAAKEQKNEDKKILENKVSGKFEKLRANVEKDLQEANAWLEANSPHIAYFFESPMQWGAQVKEIPQEHHEWIRGLKSPISFHAKDRKNALENLKRLLSRFERKKEKAGERLESLKIEEYKLKAPSERKTQKEIAKAQIGRRVEIVPGLEALVGRKAEENDQLYKSAQSRDLWFHVRGQKGGHVWIKRGQKEFGAKSDLNQKLIEKAAVLAAKNSKVSGAWIAVDYTERRFLKKSKGSAPGALQVLQSQTIFVSLDE